MIKNKTKLRKKNVLKKLNFIALLIIFVISSCNKTDKTIEINNLQKSKSDKFAGLNKLNNTQNVINSKKEIKISEKDIFLDKVQLLKHQLDSNTFSSKYFSVEFMPSPLSLVKEMDGKYYTIQLMDSASSKTLNFPIYEYTLDSLDAVFSKSIIEFFGTFKELENFENIFYIFVRGSADVGGYFSMGLKPDFKNRTIKILPKSGAQYSLTEQDFKFPNNYNNKHLPNLRGTFVKDALIKYGKNVLKTEIESKIYLLEGQETTFVNPEDRKVTFVMYINWDDILNQINLK